MERNLFSNQEGQTIIGIVIALAIFVAIAYWTTSNFSNQEQLLESYPEIIAPIPPSNGKLIPKPAFLDERVFCIQVVTPAYNPKTGECREFGTPCDVLTGWIVGGCTPN